MIIAPIRARVNTLPHSTAGIVQYCYSDQPEPKGSKNLEEHRAFLESETLKTIADARFTEFR